MSMNRGADRRAEGVPEHLRLDGIGPAGEPLPNPPSADRPEFPTLPDSRSLPRNGVVSDRFTAEGQRAVYPFEARAGEFSIFDLRSFGYERGWSSRSRMEILDSEGTVLAKVERTGPTVHRSWLPFRSPGEGRYRLVLSSIEQDFRYLLLRHSNYVERREGEARSVAGKERVHGYLNGTSDRALFHLHLAEGDEVLLRVLPAEEQMRRSLREPKESREDPGFPHYVIEPLGVAGTARAVGSRWIRADATGVYPFHVRIDPERGGAGSRRGAPVSGGLFELFIDRSPRAHSIEGLVVDRTDEPLAGLALSFRQEPDGVLYGEAITDFEGAYRIGLADGVYSVRMEDAQGRRQTFRTMIDGPRRLDALFDPGSVEPFGPRRGR